MVKTLAVLLAFLASGELSADSHSTDPDTLVAEFHQAVASNDSHRVEQFLADGMPVDSRDSRQRTALLVATHHDSVDVARLLIEAGADVNARDSIDDSPYLYAGAEGRLQILKMTIEAGANLASVNRYGGTALIPAAHHGHVDTVRYLLSTDTDIDHINFLGWTALLEAVILGDGGPVYQTIVELLLDAGADPRISDNDMVSPLEHARQRDYKTIIQLLEQAL
jgi:ankyrin repeat protein